jgi:hypothetical protein
MRIGGKGHDASLAPAAAGWRRPARQHAPAGSGRRPGGVEHMETPQDRNPLRPPPPPWACPGLACDHPTKPSTGGAGDTDGVPDDDAQFWGAFSTNGGTSFTPASTSARRPPTPMTRGTGSTTATTPACRSMAGSPARRSRTTPTAPGTTPTARCTSWTSTRQQCRCRKSPGGGDDGRSDRSRFLTAGPGGLARVDSR